MTSERAAAMVKAAGARGDIAFVATWLIERGLPVTEVTVAEAMGALRDAWRELAEPDTRAALRDPILRGVYARVRARHGLPVDLPATEAEET